MCWLAAALLALAAGCYRGSPPEGPRATEAPRPTARESEAPQQRHRSVRRPEPERSAMADVLAQMSELTDEMCACTDQACMNAVMQSLTSWSTGMAKELKEQKPTAEETKEASEIAERLSQCMMGPVSGGPPGPAPTP
jgi:hypothetical protein